MIQELNKEVMAIISQVDSQGRVKCRERNDLEYKESFNSANFSKYAKIMASFANNCGGYILFGIKDNPREIKGVNNAFYNFKQEKFTECLNSMFASEILWVTGYVESNGLTIGYIYTYESLDKPIIAQRNDSDERISSGDVFYRYRGRTEKIKYPEMRRIIEENKKREQERILKLVEDIRNNGATNIGIVNYKNGRFSTPYGVDVEIDKRLVVQVLQKAKYIKAGEFDEKQGAPVIKVTGSIDLAEEVPVPDIEPDIAYPYFEKDLIEKLNIRTTQLRSIIWCYKIKEQKKFHQETTTSRTGNKSHKYSDIALQFIADEINKNKDNADWLQNITERYKQEKGIGKYGRKA